MTEKKIKKNCILSYAEQEENEDEKKTLRVTMHDMRYLVKRKRYNNEGFPQDHLQVLIVFLYSVQQKQQKNEENFNKNTRRFLLIQPHYPYHRSVMSP